MRILIANPYPELLESVRSLAPGSEIVTGEELKARPELLARVEIAFGGLNGEQLERAPMLRWYQTTGAGVNAFLTPGVCAGPLVVTNASGIHAEPITEHMFGMLLMLTHRLGEAWDQQKGRQWKREIGERVSLLHGRTLGVLGVGAIGGKSAEVARAFGMRVIGLRRGGEPHPHVERMFGFDDRASFFAECDVVMNTLPLTERTRKFMGPREFSALKRGAIVLNAGRGATIDTEALMAALRTGRLGGALLDVTDPEPLPAGHPLWTMENVFITPHYSGGHPGYNQRAGRIFLENLRRYVAGEPLTNVVDKAEGY